MQWHVADFHRNALSLSMDIIRTGKTSLTATVSIRHAGDVYYVTVTSLSPAAGVDATETVVGMTSDTASSASPGVPQGGPPGFPKAMTGTCRAVSS